MLGVFIVRFLLGSYLSDLLPGGAYAIINGQAILGRGTFDGGFLRLWKYKGLFVYRKKHRVFLHDAFVMDGVQMARRSRWGKECRVWPQLLTSRCPPR